jgi:hypothetical protein
MIRKKSEYQKEYEERSRKHIELKKERFLEGQKMVIELEKDLESASKKLYELANSFELNFEDHLDLSKDKIMVLHGQIKAIYLILHLSKHRVQERRLAEQRMDTIMEELENIDPAVVKKITESGVFKRSSVDKDIKDIIDPNDIIN